MRTYIMPTVRILIKFSAEREFKMDLFYFNSCIKMFDGGNALVPSKAFIWQWIYMKIAWTGLMENLGLGRILGNTRRLRIVRSNEVAYSQSLHEFKTQFKYLLRIDPTCIEGEGDRTKHMKMRGLGANSELQSFNHRQLWMQSPL